MSVNRGPRPVRKIICFFSQHCKSYILFHKTLPISSLQMHWISIRFYAMVDTKGFEHTKMLSKYMRIKWHLFFVRRQRCGNLVLQTFFYFLPYIAIDLFSCFFSNLFGPFKGAEFKLRKGAFNLGILNLSLSLPMQKFLLLRLLLLSWIFSK